MSDTNKNAILLINLGSPRELSKESVKKYLKIFLSDDYVVDIPKFFQQLILKFFYFAFPSEINFPCL
jgi:ferrochelatase